MNFLKQIGRNAISSPLTSALGAGSLYATISAIVHAPAQLGNPLAWLQLLGGVALLGAADPKAQLAQQISDQAQLQQAAAAGQVQPPK
jgi:hypothetical protein